MSTSTNRLIPGKHQSHHANSYKLLSSPVLLLPALTKYVHADFLRFFPLVYTQPFSAPHARLPLLSTAGTWVVPYFLVLVRGPPHLCTFYSFSECSSFSPLDKVLSGHLLLLSCSIYCNTKFILIL